jgi:hypothetical protein
VTVTPSATTVTVTPAGGTVVIDNVDSIEGVLVTGDATGYNYEFNSDLNTIETGTGSQSNTIGGGGYTGQPNEIHGRSGYRTISGGYDNIIGRPHATDSSDTAIATTISGGAHNRVRRPNGAVGDVSANTATIPASAQTGAYPNHGTICGGSYHYIANGTDGIIAGGYGNAIYDTNATYNNGTKAVIIGGFKNAVSGNYGIIAGGESNKVEEHHSLICGGGSNSLTGSNTEGFSVLVGGNANTMQRCGYSFMGGGYGNSMGNASSDTGSFAVLSGGYQNAVGTTGYAPGAVCIGGWFNSAQNEYAVVSGRDASAAVPYQVAHGHQKFSVAGDCQVCTYVVKAQTTNATVTSMTTNAANVNVPTGGVWAFRGLVSARSSGNGAAWEIKGCAQNISGSTSIVGTATVTSLGSFVGSGWAVTITTSGPALIVQVQGQASTTVNWCGRIDTSEVI